MLFAHGPLFWDYKIQLRHLVSLGLNNEAVVVSGVESYTFPRCMSTAILMLMATGALRAPSRACE